MEEKNIVLLAGDWDTTPIVYNFLKKYFTIKGVIVEGAVPRVTFLKKRAKKMGWATVSGQVLFQLFTGRLLAKLSKQRVDEIIEQYRLQKAPVPQPALSRVSSVNDDTCLQLLKSLQPDIIVVHGTRIISKRILQNIGCPFVNIHAGITPRYRGSHGAYWALVNNDKENCGVTVHLVDAGIDTGNILFQKNITITKKDNFVTYPYLQLAEGLQLLKKGIEQLLNGQMQTVKKELNSALWHHPTLWSYWYNRIFKGVK